MGFCNFLLSVATPFLFCRVFVFCNFIGTVSAIHHSQKYNQVVWNRLHWIIRLDLCAENDLPLRSPALFDLFILKCKSTLALHIKYCSFGHQLFRFYHIYMSVQYIYIYIYICIYMCLCLFCILAGIGFFHSII